MIFLLAYIAGFFFSWYKIAGMFFSDDQYAYPPTAERTFRSDLGSAILNGCIFSTVWPIGLPAAYLLTGFAEHGVWKHPRREGANIGRLLP